MRGLSRRQLFKFAGATFGSSLERFVDLPPQSVETRQQLAPVVRQGDRRFPHVALTFDDGWGARWVEQVLDTAVNKNVKLTLFPAGAVVRNQASLWQQAFAAGHELANHTFSHSWLTNLSDNQIVAEIDAAQNVLDETVREQVKIQFLRPPGMAGFTGGDGDPRIRAAIAQRGLAVALWDVDSNSTRFYGSINARGVYETIVNSVQNGSIVLQHFLPTDAEALPWIIDNLQARGFELVTLSELLHPLDQALEPPLPIFS